MSTARKRRDNRYVTPASDVGRFQTVWLAEVPGLPNMAPPSLKSLFSSPKLKDLKCQRLARVDLISQLYNATLYKAFKLTSSIYFIKIMSPYFTAQSTKTSDLHWLKYGAT